MQRTVHPPDDQLQNAIQESAIAVLDNPIPLNDVCAISIRTVSNPTCRQSVDEVIHGPEVPTVQDEQTGRPIPVRPPASEALSTNAGLMKEGTDSRGRAEQPAPVRTVASDGKTTTAPKAIGSDVPPPPPLLKMPALTPESAVLPSKLLSVSEARGGRSVAEAMGVAPSDNSYEALLLKTVSGGDDSFMSCMRAIDGCIAPETRKYLLCQEESRRRRDLAEAQAQHEEAVAAEQEVRQLLAAAKKKAAEAQQALKAKKEEMERVQHELAERQRRVEVLRQRRIAIDNQYQTAQRRALACEHALTALPVIYDRHVSLSDYPASEASEPTPQSAFAPHSFTNSRGNSGTVNYDTASVSSTPVVAQFGLADIALETPSSHVAAVS